MTEPIRYAPGDPVEVWLTRALLLDARPAVDQLVADADPAAAEYVTLDPVDLLGDEHCLREVFGLLVLAHYRTEPNDLARLLDAPNVAVRALLVDGHVVSVALLAREGDLGADLRARMYEGERVRGNMLPDVLTTQLRDEDAGTPRGWRVLRIATHPAVRSRGLGSALLAAVEDEADGEFDWVGVGYGATPSLVDFWAANGYVPVHVSTTRNDRSGEHSALMLRPLTAEGETLRDRHVEWFRERLPSTLAGALSSLDPDVVRAVLSALPAGSVPALSDPAWRLLAGTPHGAGLFDTAPEPFARLALHALSDDGGPTLEARTERLLASRCLQRRPWETVAADLGYPSERTCMQALGECIETLVAAYGPPTARDELDRFER
jgi:tRNA(Met) cytidine acetyltransferase